jgi:4-amino-4-deoxy-L-arabinose transferase-like glycosyltransferase
MAAHDGLVLPAATQGRVGQMSLVKALGLAAAVALIAILAFARLTEYPAIWFDEGIHLHVPKAVVTFGEYADYSSDGFRYYGPTMSVGPTVMLPIAAVFKLAGVGLLQARLVIVAYLLAATFLAWRVGRQLGGPMLATLGVALLLSSRGVDFVLYGRQVLGEVPALVFMLAGVTLWFDAWERPAWSRLTLVGLLFGLAIVTKYQFVIALAPGLAGGWLLDRLFYRQLAHRAWIWPAIVMMATFAAWQAVAVFYLGPSLASENLRSMRVAAADAALTFSPERMVTAFKVVVKPSVYSSLLLPALLYTMIRSWERSRASLRWAAIVCFAGANLGWFVLASIGWPRYAFCAFALCAFVVARPVVELAAGDVRLGAWLQPFRRSLTIALVAAALVTIALPVAMTLRDMARAPNDQARIMAAYLDAHVAKETLIETWEPEMGFFTSHRYHYPPAKLLMTAVSASATGKSPSTIYDFRAGGLPDYVLEGPFARLVGLYPADRLAGAYQRLASSDGYTLYERNPCWPVCPGPGPCTASGSSLKGSSCTTQTGSR